MTNILAKGTVILLVDTTNTWSDRWKPRVEKVSRDCPKTLFTESRYGENRYRKDKIRYKVLTDPQTVMSEPLANSLSQYAASIEARNNRRQIAFNLVKETIQADDWIGEGKL